jgi:hypothetical protein
VGEEDFSLIRTSVAIENSVRISWRHDIMIDEIEKSFRNVIEAVKGLVW